MSNTIKVFDKKSLSKELRTEAKALGIPIGAAETFIDKTISGVEKKLTNKRKIITKLDLERATISELKKYNADLAYVFEIRDKII